MGGGGDLVTRTAAAGPEDSSAGLSSGPPLSMNIGPTRLSPRALARLGEQPPPLYDPGFLATYRDCLHQLRLVLEAPDSTLLLTPGTGTSALEAAAANLAPAGSSVTVASTGQWGDRWGGICERLGLRTHVAVASPGETVDVATLDRFLTDYDSGALLATHVDSSSGVRTDLAPLAEVAHRHGAMLLVDGVCAAGAESVAQAETEIDVYITSSPKALSGAAGLSITSLLPRTAALLEARDWACPSYSHDLQSWLPVMRNVEQGRFDYFQTPASNLILALAAALSEITEEGVHNRVDRHRRLRDRLHAGLEAFGIPQFVADPGSRGNGVTVCWCPEHSDQTTFLGRVRQCGAQLPTGTHPVHGDRTFRIGHLGNVTDDDIDTTLVALAAAVSLR